MRERQTARVGRVADSVPSGGRRESASPIITTMEEGDVKNTEFRGGV